MCVDCVVLNPLPLRVVKQDFQIISKAFKNQFIIPKFGDFCSAVRSGFYHVLAELLQTYKRLSIIDMNDMIRPWWTVRCTRSVWTSGAGRWPPTSPSWPPTAPTGDQLYISCIPAVVPAVTVPPQLGCEHLHGGRAEVLPGGHQHHLHPPVMLQTIHLRWYNLPQCCVYYLLF